MICDPNHNDKQLMLIPPVRSFTCLKVNVDESLEWSESIEMICKKVAAGIGLLQRIK